MRKIFETLWFVTLCRSVQNNWISSATCRELKLFSARGRKKKNKSEEDSSSQRNGDESESSIALLLMTVRFRNQEVAEAERREKLHAREEAKKLAQFHHQQQVS